MNYPRFNVGVTALVVCLFGTGRAALAQDEVAEEMDAYMSALVATEDFSGSVLVAWDGVPVFAKGYGLADREHDVPCTPETKYRLGSITKQFAAAGILLLQDAGQLSVTDELSALLEGTPETWSGITVHHLLSHQSGIWNMTNDPLMSTWWMMPSRPRETMKRFVDKPLDFEPGTRFSYSNSGYVMLALLIEEKTGQKWEDFMRANVFDPVDMGDSGHDSYEAILPHRAEGYEKKPLSGAVIRAPYHDMDIPIGGGDLYSTVYDLLKWDRALYGDELLSEAAREAMFRPNLQGYAYGWMLGELNGHPYVGHGGGIVGFRTQILRFPVDRSMVVVLSNSGWSLPPLVANNLAAILYGDDYERPELPKDG
jgi:CubicO group peptidase (beta-lactamase class C family)